MTKDQFIKKNVGNIYAPITRVPKYQYVKQILTDLKGETDNNTIIKEDFNTSLSAMDRSPRQKINKEMLDLNHTLNQIDLTDIYRTFHQQKQNIHFSQVQKKYYPGQTI